MLLLGRASGSKASGAARFLGGARLSAAGVRWGHHRALHQHQQPSSSLFSARRGFFGGASSEDVETQRVKLEDQQKQVESMQRHIKALEASVAEMGQEAEPSSSSSTSPAIDAVRAELKALGDSVKALGDRHASSSAATTLELNELHSLKRKLDVEEAAPIGSCASANDLETRLGAAQSELESRLKELEEAVAPIGSCASSSDLETRLEAKLAELESRLEAPPIGSCASSTDLETRLEAKLAALTTAPDPKMLCDLMKRLKVLEKSFAKSVEATNSFAMSSELHDLQLELQDRLLASASSSGSIEAKLETRLGVVQSELESKLKAAAPVADLTELSELRKQVKALEKSVEEASKTYAMSSELDEYIHLDELQGRLDGHSGEHSEDLEERLKSLKEDAVSREALISDLTRRDAANSARLDSLEAALREAGALTSDTHADVVVEGNTGGSEATIENDAPLPPTEKPVSSESKKTLCKRIIKPHLVAFCDAHGIVTSPKSTKVALMDMIEDRDLLGALSDFKI